jgi:uncharacterized protein YceK
MKHHYYLAIAIFSLGGCGTIKTLAQDDSSISKTLKERNTYCTTVSRAYSGVAYNWCILNAAPTHIKGWNPTIESTIIDIGLCAIADTTVLPYTLSKQLAEGPLQINNSF